MEVAAGRAQFAACQKDIGVSSSVLVADLRFLSSAFSCETQLFPSLNAPATALSCLEPVFPHPVANQSKAEKRLKGKMSQGTCTGCLLSSCRRGKFRRKCCGALQELPKHQCGNCYHHRSPVRPRLWSRDGRAE